jgi:hypothetical protein
MQPEILERRTVYQGYLAIDRLRVRLADAAIVCSLPELGRVVDEGRLADGKLITLILALRLRRPELFV